ncbi:MAG: PIG-L family deacetylase [Armatimonadota bacterium]|nr:PIG-L family deacetylase [Armatimonadota bacterium]MDR7519107.1 PIG-L family deacetylase [Armatimonadota bacterium]MDR7548964.1 PIG-L family deacetylase [Armatimonadota bacterium]
MKAACVIAAYNEARTIADVVLAARRVPEVSEVVVVSDGSTDATAEAAAAAGADLIVHLPKNLGKGGAVMAGVRRASEPVVLLLDADLENLNPQEISALARAVLDGDCDMAVGVLAHDLMQAVLPSLSGIRVVRRDALLARPDLAGTRYGFELALTEFARTQRWRVRRVPLTGVIHLRKEEKYSLFQAYQGKVLMTLDVLGLRRGRRNGAPARRQRVLAATGLVVMLAYLSMGLFSTTPAVGSALDVLPEPEASDRLLVVAAHADDELLAAGGLIQRATSVGAEVWVAFVTNGDANRLGASVAGRRLRPRPADFIAEGEERQRESRRALARLGMSPERVLYLGYPDRGLMALAVLRRDPGKPYTSPFTKASASPYRQTFRPGAAYTGADLLQDLESVMLIARPTVVLTHHEADRHSDHQALNQLVRETVRTLERQGALPRPRLLTYLVHAWDFPRPLRYAPDLPLLPPKSLRDRHRWVRFDLTAEELTTKQAAMREYRSQLDSPYLRLLLGSFVRQNELFAVTDP